jgi:hypothetical protein
MLLDGDDDDPTIIAAITALRTGLHALKWIEGQNYRFEHRSTGLDAAGYDQPSPI